MTQPFFKPMILFLAALLVSAAVLVWSLWGSRDTASPELPRAANQTDQLIAKQEMMLKQKPKDVKLLVDLASAYLQKVRETADNALYAKAEALMAAAKQIEPGNVNVLAVEAAIAAGRHDFQKSLAFSEQLARASSSTARSFGLLGDAQIELGRYDAALQSFQTMVNLRPDFGSFSRIAYARELHGDISGAIEAMQSALAAGAGYPENIAWANAELGRLYLNSNNLTEAKKQYKASLQYFPNFTPALRGLARIAWAENDEARAFSYINEAVAQLPIDPNYIDLADLHAATGDQAKADQLHAIIKIIYAEAEKSGVNVDLEYALFLADHKLDLAEALARARRGYGARPNVHAADVLSWALYQFGQYQEATHFAAEARKLGSQDPLVLFHSGMIAFANNDKDTARKLLAQALGLNPHFSYLYRDLAIKTLEDLDRPKP